MVCGSTLCRSNLEVSRPNSSAQTHPYNEYNILAAGAPNNSKGVNLKGFHILPNIDIVCYFSFERIDRNKQHRTAKHNQK